MQAADLVAWEMRRTMTDVVPHDIEPRKQFPELVDATTAGAMSRFRAEHWISEDLTPEYLSRFWQIPLGDTARKRDPLDFGSKVRPYNSVTASCRTLD